MALLSSMSIPGYGMSNSGSNGTIGPGGEIKIPGTGLTLYQGGKEATPTGMSNAAKAGGVTPERILTSIKAYQLPTTSNIDFQAAIIKKLASTPYGQQKLAEMEKTYGKTKSGNFVDNFLGARTQFLLDGLDEFNELKQIEENKPSYQKFSDKSGKIEKILSFDQDQKAGQEYFNYMISQSGKPGMTRYLDSVRKNIAPKGGKYLTTMEQMNPVLNYEEMVREKFFKKHGKYPPAGNVGKLIVPLPEDQQYNALRNYLGFQK
jgi:hypothetical protein